MIVEQRDRAQGCLLGQLVGDALGSLVEFQAPDRILLEYPNGVREMADGGTFNTLAGQPTDDSEMALALARTLVEQGGYDAEAVLRAYRTWLDSQPFDCGATIRKGLSGHSDPESQANGALMRISPLGIFGVNHGLEQVADWAAQDAMLTHPHPICLQINALFTMTITHAVRTGTGPKELIHEMLLWADKMGVDSILFRVIKASINMPPRNYTQQQGWVLIAFGNAVWQLLNAPSFEEGVVDTVMRGGDTDTNAAVCGALLGAVYGLQAIPHQWRDAVLNCRPEAGRPGVYRPRSKTYWPVDALELAEQLTNSG
ncbi:ADP-ribosylglycohydrolase family protein [Desulfonatronum thioautotrophicum]|uniref:ADP-ribosylglycohydrolase family protein n=1 Tax=Desulfonatronum thioautotrophicum TaxID=617001 RepID=UPI0005EB628A|nr:ADP-ribosylglycohydrolase family protein [Desulfonatronum thioautotrophicum]